MARASTPGPWLRSYAALYRVSALTVLRFLGLTDLPAQRIARGFRSCAGMAKWFQNISRLMPQRSERNSAIRGIS